ncbi:MAG TPA: heme biosynthesis HemY N-terminal domain-containing protein [Caulobacteraceae bacterium]|nr:heme biosynthesis HemY N-terminal domain-containing protein [Caulobacteraceae bacterium]
MIRVGIAILIVAALIVAALSLNGEPGLASVTWLGWEVKTTAAAAVLLIGLATLMATIFWRTLIWIIEAPKRAARASAETKRRQGGEALTRGFLAAAAGDGAEARRLAQKAALMAEDTPQLVRILAAQSAEAAGDGAAARLAYTAMLGFPEMRLAAHRGLMSAALADGDREEALRHATAAYGLARTAPWAWRAVLESKLETGDWAAALELVRGALERKIVSPITAERARAALQAASAASLEGSGEPRAREQALDLAQTAAKARPDFVPGPVIAARLLAVTGRAQRAAQVIETAWKAVAHPALWMAYRDLITDETPRERAGRLAALAAMNPEARESRILMVEQALIAGDAAAARTAATALDAEPGTARLAGLMARVAHAAGDRDEARAWITRGAAAPQEPDWSDLDPEGKAFAYTPADWARLVATYAETGELIHPRFERGERTISDLPEIPAAYAESAAFISAAETGGLIPQEGDDEGFGEALQPAGAEPAQPPPGQPRGPFRALGARGKAR